MKKIAIAFIALSFLFASCGKKTEESTHTHDDGSTHADHATDTVQEEFNAADTTEHTHDGQSHEHQDPQ
jgi:hypothetical protein